MKIMDCTLRDGANVLGNGFPADLTEQILGGLTANRVPIIEFGNAKGIGASEKGFPAPLTDREYLELAKPFYGKAEIGMFLNAKRYEAKNVELAASYNLSFLRVGIDAGDGEKTYAIIEDLKKHGISAYFSMMKAYLLTPEKLAEEAAGLEAHGADEITIMDSAGTMFPQETGEYVKRLKEKVKIPVGYHCHSNMGMCAANALAAFENGADILDCCLLGMARSAGNMPTELAEAVMKRSGCETGVDFYGLLQYLDSVLIPAMEQHGYSTPLKPKDLILGYSGCHSAFVKTFKQVAEETGVDLYRLLINTSKIDRKSPSEEMMRSEAKKILEMK